jgi:hypothetical protein
MLHTQTTSKSFNFPQGFGEQKESFDPQMNSIFGSHSHKVQGYGGTRIEYAYNDDIGEEVVNQKFITRNL